MLFAPHILFPVDFSGRSKAVRPSVHFMARHFRASVTLMHTIQIPAGWNGGMEGMFPVMSDVPAMIEDGRQQLLDFYEAPENGAPVETLVDYGDPATQIVQVAEQSGAGLIMMPTHGYGKFRSLLLGSVTAKVLHDADCAVWTAAHTEDPALAGRLDVRNIVCAVGLEPENASVICYAANLARGFQAQLSLIHAIGFGDALLDDRLGVEPRVSFVESARGIITALQREAGAAAEADVEFGGVADVVREAALRRRADLVVIGRGRMRRTLGRLRTNAQAIVRESPCPVLGM